MNNWNLGPSLTPSQPVAAVAAKSFQCATQLLGTWRTPVYKAAFPKNSDRYPFVKESLYILFDRADGNQVWGSIYGRQDGDSDWYRRFFTGYVSLDGRVQLSESGPKGLYDMRILCNNTRFAYTVEYRDPGAGISFRTEMDKISGIANPPTSLKTD